MAESKGLTALVAKGVDNSWHFSLYAPTADGMEMHGVVVLTKQTACSSAKGSLQSMTRVCQQ